MADRKNRRRLRLPASATGPVLILQHDVLEKGIGVTMRKRTTLALLGAMLAAVSRGHTGCGSKSREEPISIQSSRPTPTPQSLLAAR